MYILPEAVWSFMGAHSSQTTQAGRNLEQSVANVGTTTANNIGQLNNATEFKLSQFAQTDSADPKSVISCWL